MNAADVLAITSILAGALQAALTALAKGSPAVDALKAAEERIADARATRKFPDLEVKL